MSTTTEMTDKTLYITKINRLIADGREDLIAGMIADYERGSSTEPVQRGDQS